VFEERKWQFAGLSNSFHAASDCDIQFGEILSTTVGEFLTFDIAPHGLDWIEVRRIAGQAFDGEPVALGESVLLHSPALVRGEPVPHRNGFLSPESPLEILQESDQAVGVVGALAGLEEEAAATAVPAIAKGGANRYLRPVEGMDQDRRFTFGCPSAADGGTLRDAAFVLEEDPGSLAASFFFTSGQRCSSQRSTLC